MGRASKRDRDWSGKKKDERVNFRMGKDGP